MSFLMKGQEKQLLASLMTSDLPLNVLCHHGGALAQEAGIQQGGQAVCGLVLSCTANHLQWATFPTLTEMFIKAPGSVFVFTCRDCLCSLKLNNLINGSIASGFRWVRLDRWQVMSLPWGSVNQVDSSNFLSLAPSLPSHSARMMSLPSSSIHLST